MRVPLFLILSIFGFALSAEAGRPIYTLPGVDFPQGVVPGVIPSGTPPGAMAPLVPQGGIIVPTGDPAAEISQDLEQYTKTLNSMNQLNPASEQFGKMTGSGTPMLGDSAEQLEKLLSSSNAQKWIAVISDSRLRASAEALANSPRRMTLIYAEIGWFIVLLVFRAWRFSKVVKWYRRLWVSAYSLGLYWLGSAYLLPWLVFGEDYRQLVFGLIRILRR